MSESTLAEDIAAIRDYIDEHGFYQGSFNGPDGSVCIRGAIRCVSASREVDHDKWVRCRSFLTSLIGEEVPLKECISIDRKYFMIVEGGVLAEPIAYYNHEVLKDKQDALNFLDKARIRAEEIVE